MRIAGAWLFASPFGQDVAPNKCVLCNELVVAHRSVQIAIQAIAFAE